MIKSVSYSRLLDFEQCKLRAKMKHVDRIPEEKHEAAERGTAIHQMAEDFVRGKGTHLPTELLKFDDEFVAMRREFKLGKVSLEGEWGFDKDWMPADYKAAWLRMKADLVYFPTKTHAIVVDFKTGGSWGKEITHGEQVQLYIIATLIRNPELQSVRGELWYTDRDELTHKTYTRAEALRYVQPFDKRMKKVTSATTFPSNPNVFTCKYCPYGPAKGGQCPDGVLAFGDTAMKQYRRKFG
jgi:CRISPR/Cas system-associated exonuclease Cas4 (RecB family)